MTNSTPIHLAPASGPNVGVPPSAYVIHRTVQTCDCCGKSNSSIQVWAETKLKSTLGLGKYITNLRPVVWPSTAPDALYDLPIRTVDLKPQRLPFCHQCHSPSLRGWPSPPSIAPDLRIVAGHQTKTAADPKKATEGSSAATSVTPKPKKEKTLDDILGML